VKVHREGDGVGKYRWHVELLTYSGPAGGRVLQRTGEHARMEEALGALLSDLEAEDDGREEDGAYTESIDANRMPIIEPYEPSAVDMHKGSHHDRSAEEREQCLQATYSDTGFLQEAYTPPDPSPARGVGRLGPRYVTNDYLRDQGFAEVPPLQYKPYRKPQPLSQDRYLSYRLPEKKDVGYQAYRKV
jgi:hypothetical protein